MSSFIRVTEDIASDSDLYEILDRHTKVLIRLQEETGISFQNYVLHIDELKELTIKDKHAIENHIRATTQRNALKKYMNYMVKYKGYTKEGIREHFWVDINPTIYE